MYSRGHIAGPNAAATSYVENIERLTGDDWLR